MGIHKTLMAFATTLACSAFSVADGTPTVPMLWSEGHKEAATLALTLLDEPDIRTARDEVVALYENAPSGQLPDGSTRLQDAVDELLYGVLMTVVSSNPAQPHIVWNVVLPYRVGELDIPGTRYAGDTPDRMYRNIVVNPKYRYELQGNRGAKPSLDFTVEALPGPANWGLPPLGVIQLKDMNIAEDGSFTITMDGEPANGRPNHLQLPPGTIALLVRDTIADWNSQEPTALTIKGLDKAEPLPQDELISHAASQLVQSARVSLKFFEGIWKREVNKMDTYVRDLGWGIVGLNRFSLADDEALVVTIDTVSARYFGFQVEDLWMRSGEYTQHQSSLNNTQAKANADGTFSFVVSKQDPGYYNWIDTVGMNDGYIVGRWELLTEKTTGENAVRDVRKVKLAELASAMPPEAEKVSAEQRKTMLEARAASYGLRLGQK